MGTPPKRNVYQKLIRRYFKNKSYGVVSEEATVHKNNLIKCWEAHGVDHPKCQHLIPLYDRAWALDLITK